MVDEGGFALPFDSVEAAFDLLVTGADRVARAARTGAANVVLCKPNQAGTLTRVTETIGTGAEVGMGTVVSARSGETCDATIAELAVEHDAEQVKIGSLARSERLAKYNRLLGIAHRHGRELADPASVRSFDVTG